MNTEDKKNTNWLRVLLAIWLPLKYAFFIFFIFYLLYIGSENLIFLYLAILTALVYPGAVIYLITTLSKNDA